MFGYRNSPPMITLKKINSAKKIEYKLPKLPEKRRLQNKQKSLKNIKLPKIKIDSMPYIADNDCLQEQIKAKKSERVVGERNKILKDVQQKLSKVLKDRQFLNEQVFESTQYFEQKINENKLWIKKIQSQKVNLNTESNQLLNSQSIEDKINNSFQYDQIRYSSPVIEHYQSQTANYKQSPKKQKPKKFKTITSAKQNQTNKNLDENISPNFKKSESLVRINYIQQKQQLFANIRQFLLQPNSQKEQKITGAISKCRHQLEKKLQQIENKLQKKISRGEINEEYKINTPQCLKYDENYRKDAWSGSNFQKQLQKINNFQKKSERSLQKYVKNHEQVLKIQLKKRVSIEIK